MSDELIFDSERQMRRDERKRRLLPLLALAVILVMVAAVILILRGCKADSHTGGEATDYTYTWAQKANGDTELVISHEDAPNSRWDLKNGEETLPALRITRENRESKTGTVFTLHPEAAGRSLFTLVLKGEDENAEPSYEMTILAEVSETDGKLTTSLLNASGTRRQAEIIGGGSEEGEGYKISPQENQDLVLSFPIAENELDWEYELTQEQDSIRFLGMLSEDGNLNAYLRAGEIPGQGQLTITSETAGKSYRLALESAEDGSLKVISHEVEYLEKPTTEPTTEVVTTERDPERDAVQTTTGDVPIYSDDHHIQIWDETGDVPSPEEFESSPESSAPAEESTQP